MAYMLVRALVNCRVIGDFINLEYIISHNLPVCQISQPIPVLNVDSTVNQAGGISGVVDMVVDYKGHSKCI
jgi:bifunctional ADP-heptose synthase (sugar kinase/adenylyltransferase)